MRGRPITLAALVTATALAAGCQLYDATATPARPVDVGAARQALAELEVRPEDTGYHYDRDDWPHWSYVGDGCDTRDVVLREQGRDLVPGKGCAIPGGTWTSPYDGVTVTDPSDLDIDHIVPLGEAADSGVRDWTEADRETFANDPANLIAVTARSNRQKSDQDPAEWLPENTAYRCTYVARWVQVKAQYELAVDQAERDTLAGVLRGCEGTR